MGKGKNSKFVVKGKISKPVESSAFLASRGAPVKGNVSAPKESSAFLAPRGEPEKGSVTFKDSRYK